MADRTPGYIDGRRIRVGNVPNWGSVPNILTPGTLEAYGIFDDFVTLEQLAVGGNSNGWDFYESRALAGSAAALAQADVAGGVAIITCNGNDEDTGQIILGALAGGGIFHCAADKHLWFEARIRAGEVGAQSNYFVGLINPVNDDILEDAGAVPLTNPDIIGFLCYDGVANWYSIGDKTTTQARVDLTIAVSGGWQTLGFYVNGITSVQCYIDRVAAGAVIATANIPTNGVMPAIAVKAGAAAAETIEVDYVMCVQLR